MKRAYARCIVVDSPSGLAFASAVLAVEPKVGDKRPTSSCPAPTARPYSLKDFARQESRRRRLVSQGLHRRLHGRVQEHEGRRRSDPQVRRRLLHRQHRHARREQEIRQVARARLPDPQRPATRKSPRPTACSTNSAASPTAGRSTSAKTARSCTSTRESRPPATARTSPPSSRTSRSRKRRARLRVQWCACGDFDEIAFAIVDVETTGLFVRANTTESSRSPYADSPPMAIVLILSRW